MRPNIQVNRVYIVALYFDGTERLNDGTIYWDKEKAKAAAKEVLSGGVFNHIKVWEHKVTEGGTFTRFRKVFQAIPHDDDNYIITIDR